MCVVKLTWLKSKDDKCIAVKCMWPLFLKFVNDVSKTFQCMRSCQTLYTCNSVRTGRPILKMMNACLTNCYALEKGFNTLKLTHGFQHVVNLSYKVCYRKLILWHTYRSSQLEFKASPLRMKSHLHFVNTFPRKAIITRKIHKTQK